MQTRFKPFDCKSAQLSTIYSKRSEANSPETSLTTLPSAGQSEDCVDLVLLQARVIIITFPSLYGSKLVCKNGVDPSPQQTSYLPVYLVTVICRHDNQMWNANSCLAPANLLRILKHSGPSNRQTSEYLAGIWEFTVIFWLGQNRSC